ncbi:MAG: alpha/beta hydrolase-fold protein [Armatimonadetes bacterium]|nr:alpha/beta hydrolase-fold protein [Armatimonadota bacterium]
MRFTFIALAALCVGPVYAQNVYPLTPDSEKQAGVPQGRTESSKFVSKKWFPGTERSMRLYIPAQYDPKKPACVLVMQDGGGFRDTTVLDNLIAKGEIPVTIGIFITPGVVPPTKEDALPRYNRSYEYDSPTDRYAKFLMDEVLPEVGKKYNLSKDPNDHAIAGGSSGGIAAFTAAFFRPDAFRRVISFIGSYTDLRGATNYGALVRKFEPKPIRVFRQDGKNDQDIYSGSWPIGNMDLAAGLKFGRYEAMMTWGEGAHDGVQSTALFPDALRYIWKGWPAPIAVATDTPQPITKIVTAADPWQLSGDITPITSLASDATKLWRLSGPISGAATGPDGRLFTALERSGRVVFASADGKAEVKIPTPRQIVVGKNGNAYVTSANGSIWLIPADSKLKPKIVGSVPDASGVTLVPDQTLLMVSSATERYIHAFQIQPDGSLAHQQPYHEVYVNYGETKSNAGGMVTDKNGWLYVASPFGIQVLDQAGRVNGIIVNPSLEPTTQLAWLGSTLYALTKDGKVYARKTKAIGVQPFADPIRPPAPRL